MEKKTKYRNHYPLHITMTQQFQNIELNSWCVLYSASWLKWTKYVLHTLFVGICFLAGTIHTPDDSAPEEPITTLDLDRIYPVSVPPFGSGIRIGSPRISDMFHKRRIPLNASTEYCRVTQGFPILPQWITWHSTHVCQELSKMPEEIFSSLFML